MSEQTIEPAKNKRIRHNHLKEIFILLKKFFKKPTAASIEYCEKGNVFSTLILFGFLAITQGVLFIIATEQLIGRTAKHLYMFFSKANVLPEILGLLLGEHETPSYSTVKHYIHTNIKIPYESLFKHGVLFYILIVAAMTACLFLLNNGFIKRKPNLLRDFKLVTASSIAIISMEGLAMLAAIVTGYFNFLALIGVMISMLIIAFYVKYVSHSTETAVIFSSLLLTLIVVVSFFMLRIFINRDLVYIIKSISMGM